MQPSAGVSPIAIILLKTFDGSYNGVHLYAGDRGFCVKGKLTEAEDKLNLRLRIGQPEGVVSTHVDLTWCLWQGRCLYRLNLCVWCLISNVAHWCRSF